MSKKKQNVKSVNAAKKRARELYHHAEKYVDFKTLFKSGKPKIAELTKYKLTKIRAALNTVIAFAGSEHYLQSDFIVTRADRRLRDYNAKCQLPIYMRGVLITGGNKLNKNVRVTKELCLTYDKGVYHVLTAPLDASTEETLITSIESHKMRIEQEDATYVSSNGAWILPSYKAGRTPTESIVEKSLFLFHKYNSMAENGEHRIIYDERTGQARDKGVARPMKEWNYSLMWNTKNE